MRLLLFSLMASLICSVAFANDIYVTQTGTGDTLTLDITQDGEDNTVNMSVGNHTGNTVKIDQDTDNSYVGYTTIWGSGLAWGGDLDGDDNFMDIRQWCNQSTCEADRFEFHILGDDNIVRFGQGYEIPGPTSTSFQTDSYEQGGHFIRLDIHGDDNDFRGSQRSQNSSSNHTNTTYIYGDDNKVYTRQKGNNSKTLTLLIQNDDNEVSITQKSSASHSANVTLNGSYPTDFTLLQTNNTARSYTLSQNCQTSGGCTVNVTQN